MKRIFLLKYDEVAKLLRLSIVTLKTWVSEGRIPYLKIGRCVRFDENEILDWIEERRVDKDRDQEGDR